MALMKVKRCCFYFDLKTGTLLLLGILLTSSIALTSWGMYRFITTKQVTRDSTNCERSSMLILDQDIPFWLYLILIFGIMPSSVALFGIFKRNLSYIMFYIVMNLVAVVSWIISAVVMLLLLVYGEVGKAPRLLHPCFPDSNEQQKEMMFIMCKFVSILFALGASDWYFTCVVYSFYLRMERDRGHNTNSRAPSVVYSLSSS